MFRSYLLIRSLAYVASAAAVIAGTLLLLADDAGPQCAKSALDVTFDVVTTCYGKHSGTIHVTHDPSTSWYNSNAQVISGDIPLVKVDAFAAYCQRDGNPMVLQNVDVTVAQLANGIYDSGSYRDDAGLVSYAEASNTTVCHIPIPSGLDNDVTCEPPGPLPKDTCTLRLTEVK
jgi:hypothetical protein